MHYETELVLKVCKQGKYIDEKFAQKYFDEVTVGIDFTARDLQSQQKAKGLPWEIAKAFDNSAVIGEFRKVVGDNTNNGNKTEPVKEDTYTPPTNNGHTYYVIIGAFAEDKNIEAAKQRLQQKFPDSIILVQKGNRLTKLGYSVGNNFWRAKEQLSAAQSEDSTFWLLKK